MAIDKTRHLKTVEKFEGEKCRYFYDYIKATELKISALDVRVRMENIKEK
jgi:hypothetical protein